MKFKDQHVKQKLEFVDYKNIVIIETFVKSICKRILINKLQLKPLACITDRLKGEDMVGWIMLKPAEL